MRKTATATERRQSLPPYSLKEIKDKLAIRDYEQALAYADINIDFYRYKIKQEQKIWSRYQRFGVQVPA